MKKENVSYEIMIDIISDIVKKYLNSDGKATEDGEDKCLSVG